MAFLNLMGQQGQGSKNAFDALNKALDQSQAIIEFDPEGLVLTANDNFLNIMGYTLGELKGQPHRMFLEPAYAGSADYADFWARLRRGEAQSGEFKRLTKSHKDVFIEAAYMPVLDKAGRVTKIVKFAYDVTQRKLRDLDLEGKVAAIERAQAVIEFSLDGTILRANENFLAVMGYQAAEIVGKHHSLFVETAQRDSQAYTDFWRKLNAGDYVSAQFKRIGKGGKEVYIQATYNPIIGADGAPVKVVKFASDVTERVLKDADFSGQISAISRAQGVIEFELDGTILTANDNFLKVMGYSLAEIKGKHHSLFVDDTTRLSQDYQDFWRRLASGEYVSGEFHRYARNGHDVFIQASYNAILDLNGKPYKVVKYASDVTKRRQALNRTTELSHSLQSLSAAIEEMAATGRSIADTMEQTRVAADKATACVTEADASAQALSTATTAMDGIVVMITDITSQINLLALNATIELARAGEAGRGFAVVATEVKNLASQARHASEQIGAEISGVRTRTLSVLEALETIRKTVDAVQEQVVVTAGAIEEQSATSQDMARNMQVASDEADNIVRVA
ncbi:hypothetical protein MMA231_03119 [Asticcacaulis sp. MM231]|uniref:methyl-accepting chemotaxis protein n=1 Tax=Asticcacaulis sp. MM231 TaxID=3157666 RepID=UPI0032D5AA40